MWGAYTTNVVKGWFAGKRSGNFADSLVGALWNHPPQQMKPRSSRNSRSCLTKGRREPPFEVRLFNSTWKEVCWQCDIQRFSASVYSGTVSDPVCLGVLFVKCPTNHRTQAVTQIILARLLYLYISTMQGMPVVLMLSGLKEFLRCGGSTSSVGWWISVNRAVVGLHAGCSVEDDVSYDGPCCQRLDDFSWEDDVPRVNMSAGLSFVGR